MELIIDEVFYIIRLVYNRLIINYSNTFFNINQNKSFEIVLCHTILIKGFIFFLKFVLR